MKLHLFLSQNIEAILDEWVAFAQTQEPAADGMTLTALRDHAKGILQDIVLDIKTRQNADEQQQKSKGMAPDADAESAASAHGALRQASNFTLLQLSAEFRALRATVLRLWLPKVEKMSQDTIYEMVRFNEAIDQALAESIITYSARADQTRELFLAILGHDLRAPLSTMLMAGDLLAKPALGEQQIGLMAGRIKRSARLMGSMVDDLLGYTRTQLGSGMPVALRPCDVGSVCRGAMDDARATHPATRFRLEATGEVLGEFDPVRLHQLFTNLLVNAAQYGAKGEAVLLQVCGEKSEINVRVTNHGAVIPESSWQSIFKPLIQLNEPGDGDGEGRPRTSLGLGLFVAREIAVAHGGSISVQSDKAAGTTFTVILPRTPPAAEQKQTPAA